MVTIQEPVAVGDVRLSEHGPALIKTLKRHTAEYDVFSVATADGTLRHYMRCAIEAWPLLCPAQIRCGDVFEHPSSGWFTCRESDGPESWVGHHHGLDSAGLYPATACLQGGWRIASRGPTPAQVHGEELVEVGQVRAWGSDASRFLVNDIYADGSTECFGADKTRGVVSASTTQSCSRVICPALDKLRAGDRFVADGLGDVVLTDNGYGGYNVNLSMDRKQVRDLCLHDGYRLVSRGPATQAVHVEAHDVTLPAGIEPGRSYATIDDLKHQYLAAGIISQEEARGTRREAVPHEPVKVGQVRLSANHGPVAIDNYHGFRVKTADGREVGGLWSQDAISALPLLCPAWEDIRTGDVFERGVLPDLVIDQHQHRPSVRDRCLDSGWRLVARRPEKAERYAVGVDMARPGGDLTATLVAERQPDGSLRAVSADVEPSSQVARWLSDGTLSSEEAEKFVAFACRAPHSAIADHYPHGAQVFALKADAARVRRTPWYRSPAGIRGANVSAANEAQRKPHPLVLFYGKPWGPIWDRYLIELSATVEWANARPEPIRLEAHHVLACVTGAVR